VKDRQEYFRKYREKNRERLNACHREWARRNWPKRYAKEKHKFAKRSHKHYLKYRARCIARAAEWAANNLERARALKKASAQRNREKNAARRKKQRAADPQRFRGYSKRWKLANREKVRQAALRFNRSAEGRNYFRRKSAENREKNRAHHNACALAWQKAHPWIVRANCAKRRARMKAARIGDVKQMAAFCRAMLERPFVACYWCAAEIPIGKRTIDHVIPLAKGGAHCMRNLVPACKRCNSRKGSKLPHEFKP
jgi:5-methylcytosine-specific restriction endonuclease McrA